MFKSLRARLILYFSLSIALSILISALIAIALAQIYIKQAALGDLSRQAEILAGQIERGSLSPRLLRATEQVANTRVFLLSEGDESSFFGPNFEPSLDWERLAQNERQTTEGFLAPLNLRVIVVAWPLFAEGNLTGAVVLARPLEFSTEPWVSLSQRLIVAAVLSLVLSTLFAIYLARKISEPLKRMTGASRKIAQGDYDHDLEVSSSDEIGELTANFNAMTREVRRAQELQREFIASVSHELKTPLTAIQGFTQALLDGAVDGDDEKQRSLEIIAKEGSRLERLIQDLLDLAKLDSKHFSLKRHELDLQEFLKEYEDIYRARAKKEKVRFRVQIGRVPPLYTDGHRLRQIIGNLLENAFKFTPAGGRITLKSQHDRDNAVVEISDTGPGIDKKDLPHIFERFYGSDKHGRTGFGLGLAIAFELTAALGGNLSATSVPGKGSTFRVTFPATERNPGQKAGLRG
ncbi:MAG: sensor histidine kinase [Terriglobia bacterium]